MKIMHDLHIANIARGKEWEGSNDKCGIDFWGVELAGEVGEACNIIKKLERERIGLRGSRATLHDLADELADVIICVDLIACHIGTIVVPQENKLPWLKNKSLADLGNGMFAAAGMVCHVIESRDRRNLVPLLCILVNRVELIARSQKIDLGVAVRNKFNATSEKYNLITRISA